MIQLKIQPKIKKSADKTSNHISIGVNKGVDIGVNLTKPFLGFICPEYFYQSFFALYHILNFKSSSSLIKVPITGAK
jgi:hypothetical protein